VNSMRGQEIWISRNKEGVGEVGIELGGAMGNVRSSRRAEA